MWLPQPDATGLLSKIGESFDHSQLILDMVPEKFTRGIWKSLFRLHAKIEWGLDVAWIFGIKDPYDIEAYGSGLKVIGVDEGSVGPVILASINTAQ